MKLAKIILGALMVVAMCSAASATLDAKVYTLCEGNLSMNLTPNYHIIPSQGTSSPSGLFSQGFTITGSGSKGLALLETVNIYDETMKLYDTEALSQIFTSVTSSALSYSGNPEMDSTMGNSYIGDSERDNTIGNWSAVDRNGENVTVATMDTKGSLLSIYGKKVDIAFWNLNGDNYAYLVSSFDQNVTRQIISSLKIN
jgi:hypothetical protein